MKSNFSSIAEKYKGEDFKSDWFKFKEGLNRVRVLTNGEVLAKHFKLGVCFGKEKGCPFHTKEYEKTPSKPKWLMWIIDRKDGKIKLAEMPLTIIRAIADLQNNEDYSFDEVPMPYDLNITANNAGTLEVKYSVVPARNNTPLTEQEQDEQGKLEMIEDIIQRLKESQMKKIAQNSIINLKEEIEKEEDINPDDIPF